MTITLTDVADQLEALAAQIRASAAPTQLVSVPRGNGDWSKDDLAWLHREIQHLPGALVLLDVTAEHPDEEVVYDKVVERAGTSSRQVANELARMSRLTTNRFGSKQWPLEAWQASSGKMHYRMPSAIADWWRSIRG